MSMEKQTTAWQQSITLPNDIASVPQLHDFVDSIAEKAELDMSLAMSICLALEEAVVNVMSYAYPPDVQGEINIEASLEGDELRFVVSDAGQPFDPTAQADVDTTLSAEERPIGGLGIFLVRQIMDNVSYERLDGKNVLTMRKNVRTEEQNTLLEL